MLSKKYYKKLAEIIRDSTEESEMGETYIEKDELVARLSSFLVEDNSNFNKFLFIDACYEDENK
jgi:hypothetical protein